MTLKAPFITRIAFMSLFFLGSGVFALSAHAEAVTIDAEDVIVFANAAREEQGIAPLAHSEILAEVAQKKLDDMIAHHYFDHTSPDGVTPWKWFGIAGYDYKYAGENLAMDFRSARDQQFAWMQSETHRANILNGHYKEVGVAVGTGMIDGKETQMTVQVFATPKYRILSPTQVAKIDAQRPAMRMIDQSATSQLLTPIIKGVAQINAVTLPERLRTYGAWTFLAAITVLVSILEYIEISRLVRRRQKMEVTA